MKLSTAIEILDLAAKDIVYVGGSDYHNAVSLGIEAMKTIESSRLYNVPVPLTPLPGETPKGR